MIVWTLVVGLGAADGEVSGGGVMQAVNAYADVAQCEAAGKKWASALSKLVIGTKIEYTITCVQQDFVLVAKGSDPLKI